MREAVRSVTHRVVVRRWSMMMVSHARASSPAPSSEQMRHRVEVVGVLVNVSLSVLHFLVNHGEDGLGSLICGVDLEEGMIMIPGFLTF